MIKPAEKNCVPRRACASGSWVLGYSSFKDMSKAVAMKKEAQTISFAEIVHGRDASVRVTEDNLLYAVDLAMVVTGKSRNYAGQVIKCYISSSDEC